VKNSYFQQIAQTTVIQATSETNVVCCCCTFCQQRWLHFSEFEHFTQKVL